MDSLINVIMELVRTQWISVTRVQVVHFTQEQNAMMEHVSQVDLIVKMQLARQQRNFVLMEPAILRRLSV